MAAKQLPWLAPDLHSFEGTCECLRYQILRLHPAVLASGRAATTRVLENATMPTSHRLECQLRRHITGIFWQLLRYLHIAVVPRFEVSNDERSSP